MTRSAFEYTVLRAVPRVDRGEFVNVGVVLYCQDRDFLGARIHIDPSRLRSLDAAVDLPALEGALAAVAATCAADPAAGPMAEEPQGARFRWLASPRSTMLQPGPVHAGMSDDPSEDLDRLFSLLVR